MRRFPLAVSPRLAATLALVLVTATLARPEAQIAGRNVNMVTGGTFPGGDPFRAKQNETSLAISTRNPCHLLAGANDYRSVFLPGLPDDKEIGDCVARVVRVHRLRQHVVQHARSWLSAGHVALKASLAGLRAQRRRRSGRPLRRGRDVLLPVHRLQSRQQRRQARARARDRSQRLRGAFIDPDKIDERRSSVARGARSSTSTPPRLRAAARASSSTSQASRSFRPRPAPARWTARTVPATNVYVAWTEFVGNSPENQRSKVYFARSTRLRPDARRACHQVERGLSARPGHRDRGQPQEPERHLRGVAADPNGSKRRRDALCAVDRWRAELHARRTSAGPGGDAVRAVRSAHDIDGPEQPDDHIQDDGLSVAGVRGRRVPLSGSVAGAQPDGRAWRRRRADHHDAHRWPHVG